MAGSKADIPKDLLDEVRRLEELFTVDQKKLKSITEHFITELAKGTVCSCHPFSWRDADCEWQKA